MHGLCACRAIVLHLTWREDSLYKRAAIRISPSSPFSFLSSRSRSSSSSVRHHLRAIFYTLVLYLPEKVVGLSYFALRLRLGLEKVLWLACWFRFFFTFVVKISLPDVFCFIGRTTTERRKERNDRT